MEDEGKRARQWRDRKRECVRGKALRRERDGVSNKLTCGANVRFIIKMIKNVANDYVPTICIFSLLIYKRHLDPMTSRKLHVNVC